MVRLKGPALSTDAAGSLADAITFATNNKRRSLRTKGKPKNTKSNNQLAIRAMMAFLSANWAALSTADKATWEPPARAAGHAPYHAYIKHNMKRWRTFRPPAKLYPSPETPPAPAPASMTAWGGFHCINYRLWLPVGTQPWGWTIHLAYNAPCVAEFKTTRHVLLKTGAADVYWTMRDLPPGNYKTRAKPFCPTGLWGINSSERSATVT